MFKRFFLSERNMMIAILLNAIVIFFMHFPQFKFHPALEILDHLFVIVFLLETIIKLKVLKPKNYFSDRWNQFDFIVVCLSSPSLFILSDANFVLLLRLFRLFRLIKFIRFVPHLSMIIEGLKRAGKASLFVLIALGFLNFLLAVFTCHVFGEKAPEYFGNPLLSAYSIFQMFTVEGWNEIPQIIASRTDSDFLSGLSRFYFVLVVLIGGIFGMSLANAIFVDEMTMDNTRELETKIDALQEQMEELKALIQNKG